MKKYFPYILTIIILLVLIISFICLTDNSPSVQNTNTSIQKSSGLYTYENTNNSFQTYFKDSPIKESSVSFHINNSQISFYTPPEQSFGKLNPSSSSSQDNTVTYKDIFLDTDLKYTVSSHKLLEEFIVRTQPTALKFARISQMATTKNIDRYQNNPDGSIDFFYKNQLMFTLPKPVIYELSHQENRTYGIEYQITPLGNDTYQIDKVITPAGQQWLANLNRNYPIAIDLVIDNADTSSSWTSSDPTYTTVSTENSIIVEGSASVKVQTSGLTGTNLDYMEYSTDALAQSAFVTDCFIASGGTTSVSGLYKIHVFSSSGTFTASKAGNVDALVVAGGGSGGDGYGSGGGGGGGVTRNTSLAVSSGSNSVTVASTTSINSGTHGNTGGNSSFKTLTAYGGGRGSSSGVAGGDGGSGGGGSTLVSGNGSASGGIGSQGSDGAASYWANDNHYGGGGGGYSAAGNLCHGGTGYADSVFGLGNIAGGGGAWGDICLGNGTYGGGYGTGNPNGGSSATNYGGGGGGGCGGGAGTGYGGVVAIRYFYDTLQSYSESTIKTQGSYSLKGIAQATNSLNQTLIKTFSTPVDLSEINTVTFDIRASRTGSNIKVGLHDSGGTTTEITPNITSADTFQSASIDLSGVTSTNKDAINQIIVTIVNADAVNTFYLDNFSRYDYVSENDNVTLTRSATDLSSTDSILFWIRSTLSGQTLRFQFGELDISENTYDITINNANTWEQKTVSLSSIDPIARDAISKFAFVVIDSTDAQTFYFDFLSSQPVSAKNCLLEKSNVNDYIKISWIDMASDEDGYLIERNVDGTSFSTLTTLSSGYTGHTDNDVSSGHTYQYRVAPYYSSGPTYGNWCTTSTLNLQSGSLQYQGIIFN